MDQPQVKILGGYFFKLVRVMAAINAAYEGGDDYITVGQMNFGNSGIVADILAKQWRRAVDYDNAFAMSEKQQAIVDEFMAQAVAIARTRTVAKREISILHIAEQVFSWMSGVSLGQQYFDFFTQQAAQQIKAPTVAQPEPAPVAIAEEVTTAWTDADEALTIESDASWAEYERNQPNPFDLISAPKTVKMTMNEFRALTMDEAARLLDIVPGENTYVYFNMDWELETMEKPDRHSDPDNELVALGYFRHYR